MMVQKLKIQLKSYLEINVTPADANLTGDRNFN